VLSTMIAAWKCLLLLHGLQATVALQGFKLPKIAQVFQLQPTRQEQEAVLLKSISNTQFGKTATIPQQREILGKVSALETKYPAPALKDILQSGDIDGTWFLQFTAPSEIDDDDTEEKDLNSAWKIENPEENIPTRRFEAKGSVSAAGIDVDVSMKPPKQIFDISQSRVYNEVVLPKAFVRVGGPFRLSEKNERRAVVKFEECNIDLGFVKLDLGFLFGIIRFFKGANENGWLETTYLSDAIRIGRGNKGSMFILTRDEGSVLP
jgi:hypothetical protein